MIGQLIIESLAIGAGYGLLATAMVIIYKTSEVVNFAQGEMAMFSTFISFHILSYYKFPFWVSFVVTMIFAIILGMIIEFVFLRRSENPSIIGLLMITLGVEMILMGLAGWKWGALSKNYGFPISPYKTYEPIKGLIISDWDIGILVTSVIIMAALYFFFKYVRLGKAMRATQQNKNAAKIMGIKVNQVFAIAWGISSMLGAIAGMFFAAKGTLDNYFMMEPLLKAFAAAVLGGLTSIPGALLGGCILGLIENFFGYAWPAWKPIVAFLIIILVLCVKPSGLFSKHYVKKV